MKKVVNKPQQEIAVEDCTDDKVYIATTGAKLYYYMLTRSGFKTGKYQWRVLDKSFTSGNARDEEHATLIKALSFFTDTYQFDTMREAMLFVFGEKEVGNG